MWHRGTPVHPCQRPPLSHQSVLTLGDFDMRYAVDPKALPLWLPLCQDDERPPSPGSCSLAVSVPAVPVV
jgi:hypothetical protein